MRVPPREVSYSPTMAYYLTYLQGTSFAYQVGPQQW